MSNSDADYRPLQARDVARLSARNFAIGYAVKLLIAITKHLISGRLRAIFRTATLANTDNITFGGFLAALPSLYHATRSLLLVLLGRRHEKQNRQVHRVIAAAVAGVALALLRFSTRIELTMYIFMRAICSGLQLAVTPRFPALAKFRHWDTVLMSISSAQLLAVYVFDNDAHAPAYRKFLNKFGAADRCIVDSIGTVAMTGSVPSTPALVASVSARGGDPETALPVRCFAEMCGIVHPNQTCFGNWLRHMLFNFSHQCFPLYLPLKVVLQLVSSRGRRKLLYDPLSAASDIVLGTAQSSLFLAVYCANAWLSFCMLNRVSHLTPLRLWLVLAPAAGVANFIEAPKRRMDLALYCAPHALRSAFMVLRRRGLIPRMPYLDVLAFVYAMAFNVGAMDGHPEVVHPIIRRLLRYLIGLQKEQE